MTDQSTSQAAEILHPVLSALSARLEGNYGGKIEHLWIDLELIESHAKADGSPRHPFRFQKRVSGGSRFGLPAAPDKFNVGHFSVRPDFDLIRSLSTKDCVAYTLSLIYRETTILHAKSKKLGGFNADAFRLSFLSACEDLGYPCVA